MDRRSLGGVAAFLAGLGACGLLGKGVAGVHVLASVVPNGIFLEGLVLGALNGLLAIGLVLIYRTNRIINFAQGEMGAIGATLASELYRRYSWPYLPAVALGLLAALGGAALVELGVIRRFSRSPRLILTVATIGIAQIYSFAELSLQAASEHGGVALRRHDLRAPLSAKFTYGNVVFGSDHVLVLLLTPVVIAGLIWFLRGTGYGLAARAAAENSDRARLLGVRVKRVSLLIWIIAGGLSAFAAILQEPILGFDIGTFGGYTLLLRALAAAVIGRMDNLPITFAAALLITTAQQVLFFGTSHSGPDDAMVLGVLVVALLVQRRRIGRLEGGESSWKGVAEVRPIPTELRALTEVRVARWGGLAIAAIAAVVPPLVLGPRNISLLSAVLIYAMVGVSLVILTGWSGNVSFGQWALVGVGGMISSKLASLANPPDFFLIVLLAGACGALVAVIIGLPALRIRGFFLGVTTLAFAVAAGNWFFTFRQLIPDTPSIPRPVMFGIWDVSSERRFYLVCLAGLVLALLVGRNVRRSRLGRVLIGVRDNELQAQSLGVSITRAKLSAFAASGFIAAVAGVVYAYQQQNLRAERFPAAQSIAMFSMVVIGGMGSMSGALLGAAYIKAAYFLPSQFQPLAFGSGVLVLLWVFPGGLGQILYTLRDTWLRWVANRRGIVVPSLVADRRVEGLRELAQVPEPELPLVGGRRQR